MYGEDAVQEDEETWRIPCRHRVFPGASEEALAQAEQAMGFPLPEALKELLQITNGLELYVSPAAGYYSPTFHIEYRIFSTTELVTINQNLLKDFRAMLGDDPDFRDVHALNYVAFCDAHDGNYLAILLEGPERSKVFFLDHEYLFRPYSEQDADLYYTVAPSLDAWLELVAKTEGWGGFGEPTPMI
jgi:hypothetical protein